jgi:hypothetical protein
MFTIIEIALAKTNIIVKTNKINLIFNLQSLTMQTYN